MTNIDLITIIGAYFNIIPIIYYLFSYRKIDRKFKSIFVYLIICIIVETVFLVNHYYIFKNTKALTISFLIYESIFIFLFYRESISEYLRILISLVLSLFVILILIDTTTSENIRYELFLGGSRIINLIVFVNVLLSSFNRNYPNWNKIIIIAFLQNTIINATIFSFASFFIENIGYVLFYVIFNAISNIILYLLLTYSIYICRKNYS